MMVGIYHASETNEAVINISDNARPNQSIFYDKLVVRMVGII